jgi:hypothetical protein
MTIEYKNALGEMRIRRMGDDYAIAERYQKRATQPAIQYALGSMQEVDPSYTRISIEEGLRVAGHVKDGSEKKVEIRIQGSVPLNTHIRRASDVDMLVINEGFFNYDRSGSKATLYASYPNFPIPGAQEMSAFRKECEDILTTRFYAANVDTTGAKAIQLSEGSVARKVDIVPANWYRGLDFQNTGLKEDKEIQIYNKETGERPRNHPFKFIHQVEVKDSVTQGGVKKSVRMLKNIKNDSSSEIELSSYDITSLIWNLPNEWLDLAGAHDLTILANTQAYLEYLINRPDFTKNLNTPDGSRKAIDTPEKLSALNLLSTEVTNLAQVVYEEGLEGVANSVYSRPSIDTVRQWLSGQRLAG